MKLFLFSVLLFPLSQGSLYAQQADASNSENSVRQALREEEARLLAQAAERKAAEKAATAREPAKVNSVSGAFTVTSYDSLRAGAVASRAEDIFKHLQQLISLPAKTNALMHIELVGDPHDDVHLNPYQLSIDIHGDKPVVRMRVHVGGGIHVPELHRAIVRLCLYEYALRHLDMEAYADGGEESVSIPLWLTTGVEQAILWRGGRLEKDIFAQLFQQSEVLSIHAILDVSTSSSLDGTTRQLFEASCTALMLSLLSQEGGEQAVLSMIASGFDGEQSARQQLMQHFHATGIEDNALQKWWALELANMSTPSMLESMTPMQTEEALAAILSQTYVNRSTGQPLIIPVDNFQAFTQHPEWRALIPSIQRKLQALYVRSFPSYRPIIEQYQKLLTQLLLEDDATQYTEALEKLFSLRGQYKKFSTRTRDYLDWYEMTQLGGEMSADFQQYLRMREMLRRQPKAVETHMSRYLRDIEMLMELKAGEDLPKHLQKEAHKAQSQNEPK